MFKIYVDSLRRLRKIIAAVKYRSNNYTSELRRKPAEAQNHITLKSRDYTSALEPGITVRYNRALIYTLALAIVPRQNCDVIYANTADYSTLK